MEKGCIFALAFDKERRFKERDAKRKRENIERMEQYEIACVTKKFSDARHLGAVTQKSQRL